jgi:hypothetical protein
VTRVAPEIGSPVAESREVSERLVRLRAECGCAWGARAMCLGLVASLVVLGTTYATVVGFLLHAPIALGVAAVSGGVGKTVAIAVARHRYRRAIAEG